jgi:hypothetical protein
MRRTAKWAALALAGVMILNVFGVGALAADKPQVGDTVTIDDPVPVGALAADKPQVGDTVTIDDPVPVGVLAANKPQVGDLVTIDDPIPIGDGETAHRAYLAGQNGYILPNAAVTRAEAAMMFFRLLSDEQRQTYSGGEAAFSDVKSDAWYAAAVSALREMGLLKGNPDGTFRPDAPVTRAEFASMLVRFEPQTDAGKEKTFSDLSGCWARAEIESAASCGWVRGFADGSFRPDTPLTRAEAAAMLNRAENRRPGSKADLLAGMKTFPDNLDESAWYYLDLQEAANSHSCTQNGRTETWTELG